MTLVFNINLSDKILAYNVEFFCSHRYIFKLQAIINQSTSPFKMTEFNTWPRPESIPLPTVWRAYNSKKPMPNGVAPKFRIQDYTEEWEDAVLHCMLKIFLKDEPLSKSLGLYKDPVEVEQFQIFIRHFLAAKAVLIAVVENYEELNDKNLPKLAGCNITGVIRHDDDNMKKTLSKKVQKIFTALHLLEKKCDPYKYYDVTEVLYALGLSVDPAYRGYGLAEEILRARNPLCKAIGIKVSVTVFTAERAQKAAQKAGYEPLSELIYKDYKNEKGEIIFKIDSPKSMKLMGLKIY